MSSRNRLHVSEYRYTVSDRPGVWPSVRRSHPGKKGTTMEFPVLAIAIVVIVAFGLYRFMRARAAH